MKFGGKIFSKANLLYALFLIAFTLVSLEIILRVFHPFYYTLRGNDLVLPVNIVYKYHNSNCTKLAPVITCSRNSIGFRGEEKPKDADKYLSIITIGGSTTACTLLSDSNTWSFLLSEKLKANFNNIWLNNAGIDGASTFAHQLLMDNYIVQLKPKVVIFLVGTNDVGSSDPIKDMGNIMNYRESSWLCKHSEVIDLLVNYMRSRKAKKLNLDYKCLDFSKSDTATVPESIIDSAIAKEMKLIPKYRARLLKLITTCKENKIESIFITQPSFEGFGIDSITGVDLGLVISPGSSPPYYNGKERWAELELYNKETMETAQKK